MLFSRTIVVVIVLVVVCYFTLEYVYTRGVVKEGKEETQTIKEIIHYLPQAECNSTDSTSPYLKSLLSLPPLHEKLKAYFRAPETSSKTELRRGAEFLPELFPYIFRDAEKEAIQNLTRPPLPEANCSDPNWSHLLTGRKRDQPIHVYDTFAFSAEFDIFEVRLMELRDIVTKHIVLESSKNHRLVPKPLFLKRGLESRLKPFADRIHYVLTPEINMTQMEVAVDWRLENQRFFHALDGFLADVGEDSLRENDLFLIGDLDEVPLGESLWQLKECELKPEVKALYFCADFYVGSLAHLFHSDYPCPNAESTTLPFPRIYTWNFLKDILKKRDYWTIRRNAESKPIHTHSGFHITWIGENHVILYKLLSLAEGGKLPALLLKSENYREVLLSDQAWRSRMKPNSNLPPPWFIRDNPMRYYYALPPMFENSEVLQGR